MKIFWKTSILQMAEGDIFFLNEALMRMVQWKSSCDYYLLRYEHFYLPTLPI